MHQIYLNQKKFWQSIGWQSLLSGFLFFVLAILVQHVAYNYIDNRASVTPVGDLLLDNLPIINLDIFIVQGSLILTLIIVYLFLIKPKYFLFSIKSLALFLIIRSFFISLTHLGVNLHQLTLNIDGVGFGIYDFLYNSKNDFFFSGHVGVTFLYALILWKETFWRNLFLIFSFIMGISMIFGHMHYSIDIFAAPFITYSIFSIAKKVFTKDFKLITG